MNTEIAHLQARLAAQRRLLAYRTAEMNQALNLPRRIHRELRAHPLKWTALALTGGLVAARAVPIAFAVVRAAASRKLLGKFAATLAPVALRAGLNRIEADRQRAALRRALLTDSE